MAAASAARANAPQETARRVADYFSRDAMQTEVAPRLGRLATRAAQGAITGGALGAGGAAATGNDIFSGAATGIGTGAAVGLNAPGVRAILQNASSSPLLQTRALEALSSAAGKTGAASSAIGSAAGRELTSEPFDPLRRALMEYFRRQQPQEPTQ